MPRREGDGAYVGYVEEVESESVLDEGRSGYPNLEPYRVLSWASWDWRRGVYVSGVTDEMVSFVAERVLLEGA